MMGHSKHWQKRYPVKSSLDPESPALTLIKKIETQSLLLDELYYVSTGTDPRRGENGTTHQGKDVFVLPHRQEGAKPYLEAKEVRRYGISWERRYLQYQPKLMHRPKFSGLFEHPKILVSAIAPGLSATYDEDGFYVDQELICCVPHHRMGQNGQSKAPKTYDGSNPYDARYVLGLMNSKVLAFYFQATRLDSPCVRPGEVRRLPIRRLDFLNFAEVCAQDEIVVPVARMLALQMQRQAICPQAQAHDLDCQIQQVDQEIDCQVYELYGLTGAEIDIVEGRSESLSRVPKDEDRRQRALWV
jgi:restriction endonuclease TaqI-like protein